MGKKIFIIVLMVILFFTPCFCSYVEDNGLEAVGDYARIIDVDYSAKLVDEPDNGGKLFVTERVTFDVHAASRDYGFYELWLDLCEDEIDGLKVYYNVKSVKQILPNGEEIVWEKSPRLYWEDYDFVSSNKELGPGKWFHSYGPYDESARKYECIFFYVDNLYREQITFEIEYEMYNAVLRYGDCSDLYVSFYSGDTIDYLNSFNGEILIPLEDMPEEGNYRINTLGTNANNFEIKESTKKNPGYHTIYFELTEEDLQFKPYNEYLEMEFVAFGDDKHKFSDYANVNDYYNDDVLDELLEELEYYNNIPNLFLMVKIITLCLCLFITLIVVVVNISKVSRFKNKFPFYSPKVPFDSFRDIPSDLDPKFAAALVFSKDAKQPDDSSVYSAILLSLARKNYITLEDTNNDDVLIKINEELVENTADNATGQFVFDVAKEEPQRNENTPYGGYNQRNDNFYPNGVPRYSQYNDGIQRDVFDDIPYNGVSNNNSYGIYGVSGGNGVQTNGNYENQYGNNATNTNDLDDWLYGNNPANNPTNNLYQNNNDGLYEYEGRNTTGYQNPYEVYFEKPDNVPPTNNHFAPYGNVQNTNPNYGNDKQAFTNVARPLDEVGIVEENHLEPLTLSEEHYFNLIKRHAQHGVISMYSFQKRIEVDYNYTNSFVKNMNKSVIDNGINLGYFQKAYYLEPKEKLMNSSRSCLIWGIIFLVVVNIISSQTRFELAFGGFTILGLALFACWYYLKSQAHKYVLLTEFGENEYNKWRGLYNFLKSDTLINERSYVELPIWEKYLVYATAFGISEKVINAIKIRCVEVPVTTTSIVNHNYVRSHRIRSHSRSFHTSVHRGASGFHSSSGGGFGYGGGGRGGGGGGGGH